MKRIHLIFLSAAILLMLMACSTAKFGWEAEPEADLPESAGEAGYVEDFDPLSLEEEDIRVTPNHSVAEQPARSLKPAVTDTPEEVPESDLVPGFRVQLFASESEQNANEAKRKAIFKFEEQVYLDFQGAFYRLYVGDFIDKKDAESLAKEAQRTGFPGAWVVPARVNPKKVQQEF
ncbi:SPOR domain-containing protein [bacterium]|nr:SPOR domain-containing protein [bacterium]